MASFNKQRITQSSGTISYDPNQGDTMLALDVESAISEITVEFPPSPYELQTFGISTRSAINSLILTSTSIPVSGSVSSLAPGGFVSWFYCVESNRWFRER